MKPINKIALSGVVIASYIVIMYFTQNFAFSQYQVRIATGLYALAYHFPFLAIPLSLANLVSNTIMGGLGLYDMLGGFVAGFLTTKAIVFLKRFTDNKLILLLPIAVVPSLLVPLWLSVLLNIPYWVLVASLSVGQFISAYTLGLLIIKIDIPSLLKKKDY